MTREKRTRSIKIYVTEQELEKLNHLKQNSRLAGWIRELALSNTKQQVTQHIFPPEMVRTLSGIGSNLNQISRSLNTLAKSEQLPSVNSVELLVQLCATEKALNGIRDFLKQ